MKFFLDSADLDEIISVKSWGILDGVTTNPSLIKKAVESMKSKGKHIDMALYIEKILYTCRGVPVSLEVIGTSYDEIVAEGIALYKRFNKIAKNVVIKVPVNPCLDDFCSLSADGIKAINYLSKKRIPVNCTLVFSPEQALIAAKAGAQFVSPFAGRIDDYISELNRLKTNKKISSLEGKKKIKKIMDDNGIISGVDLIKKTKEIFVIQGVHSEVLAASIRNPRQFREVALSGADAITAPFNVFKDILQHHKSVEGMRNFAKDTIKEYSELFHGVRKK